MLKRRELTEDGLDSAYAFRRHVATCPMWQHAPCAGGSTFEQGALHAAASTAKERPIVPPGFRPKPPMSRFFSQHEIQTPPVLAGAISRE